MIAGEFGFQAVREEEYAADAGQPQEADRPEDLADIPNAYETCRLQKRPFIAFLTRRLVKGA